MIVKLTVSDRFLLAGHPLVLEKEP